MKDKNNIKNKIIKSLERSLGIVTPACKENNISRDTFYRWMKEDEDFKQRVDEVNDLQGDFVENQLFKKIKEGSERSIIFYMKYKGKLKGYSDRVELDVKGINFNYIIQKEDDD